MSVSALSGATQLPPDGSLSVGRVNSHSSSPASEQALATSADPRGGQQSFYGQVVHAYSFPSQMASDGRYLYQNTQETQPTPYPYAHYPPSSYDSTPQQYASNPPRPVRNTSTQSHSPNQPPAPAPAAYNSPAPSGYPTPTSYPSSQQFGVAPPPPTPATNPQQWAPAPDNWSHYQQQFTQPNPPLPETQSFNASPGNTRAEPPPAAPTEHRVVSTSSKSKPDARREERAHRPAEAAPQPKVRKTREPEPPAHPPPPQVPLGLDFVKLLESYRLIIDSSNAITNDPTQVRPEVLERMLHAASYGAQALDATAKRVAPELQQETREREGEEGEGSAGKVAQKVEQQQQQQQHPTEGQTCLGCNATSTPEWRRGPMGPRTLCNACGLVYAKLIKKRTREPGRTRGAQPTGKNAKMSRTETGHASSDSDDDGSFSSNDRRSELGEQGARE